MTRGDEVNVSGSTEHANDPHALPGADAGGFGESLELVRKAQAGDRMALSRLFERYQDRLHRIARVRMGQGLRETMDSMDLVQETHAVALRKIGDFEPREHAGIVHWLERILENKMRDARKGSNAQKRDRRRRVALDSLGAGSSSSGGFDPAGDGPTPSQDASRRELERIYDACVEALQPEQRNVILLRDYEGGSWEHVSEQMERTVHAVQELHRRARIKLAALLRRGGFSPRGEPDTRTAATSARREEDLAGEPGAGELARRRERRR